jgi:hypothetical protein
MSEKIVKITINPKGEASIEADGFKGSGCKDATKVFEAIYDKKLSYTEKPEMFEGASCGTRIHTQS